MLSHPGTGHKERQSIAQALQELTAPHLIAAAHIFIAAFSSNLFYFHSRLAILT